MSTSFIDTYIDTYSTYGRQARIYTLAQRNQCVGSESTYAGCQLVCVTLGSNLHELVEQARCAVVQFKAQHCAVGLQNYKQLFAQKAELQRSTCESRLANSIYTLFSPHKLWQRIIVYSLKWKLLIAACVHCVSQCLYVWCIFEYSFEDLEFIFEHVQFRK